MCQEKNRTPNQRHRNINGIARRLGAKLLRQPTPHRRHIPRQRKQQHRINRRHKPSTHALPDSLRVFIRNGDAIIMERHGVVCVGGDLIDAYKKLEMVEHTAKITHAARSLGEVVPIAPPGVQALLDTRKTLGIYTKNNLCDGCGAREVCAAPIYPE